MSLIDSHTHLDSFSDSDISDILTRSKEAGVTALITAGTTYESSVRAVEITSKFEEIFAGIGIHPMDLTGPVDEQLCHRLINLASSSKKVVVIAGPDKQKDAEQAGADVVGGEEIVEKIQNGWTDFDAVVSTPDMMKSVGKLGRVLGPRGLMPNPKTGTVTLDVTKAVEEIKAGKVEFRVDKAGVIHAPIGKLSFSTENLIANAYALTSSVMRAKPATAKGKYLKSMAICSTMGPGVRIDGAGIEAHI